MAFDFTNPELVLTGTIYGETSGCGLYAMQNVAQVVLNRVNDRWNAGGLVGVCLAPYQFSCWNANDPNRARIIQASAAPNNQVWVAAQSVAHAALSGTLPNRVKGADSYYAENMRSKPSWAKEPGFFVFSDGYHDFWQLRPEVKDATNVSVMSAADLLNAQQLQNISETT
jgi:N-acetylmuramoyl-L-alanine amidase